MSVNSSSSSNDSLLRLPFIQSYFPSTMYCYTTKPGLLIYTPFYITHVLLLLPLSTFTLYLGLQRLRSTSAAAAAAMSHADNFTYHMVTMELVGVLGYTSFCYGIYRDHAKFVFAGYCLFSLPFYGEMFFHLLTCVERYLAVVHPIVYLSLKGERGIRIRNISIGCVWLLSFGVIGLLYFEKVSVIVDFCSLIFSLIVILPCSLSVLFVLIRPGPGDKGGDRERVDQQKKKAFYTILAILAVLLVRFSWNLFWVVLYITKGKSDCVVMVAAIWFNLPASLVLPLLFLHRAGKLACCGNNRG